MDAPAGAWEQGIVPIDRSGWVPEAGPLPGYPRLEHDVDVDVVVVGAGLTGSSAALRLAERGVAVALLEAEQPGFGASGRNAGHVQPYLGSLPALRRLKHAGQPFLEHFLAHRRIVFELCAQHGIEADAAPVGLLDVARRPHRAFDRLAGTWRRLGLDVRVVGGSELHALAGTRAYVHGLHWNEGGRVNPYLLTNGLVAAATRRGARVHGHSPVTAVERAGEGWLVRTPSASVRARRVLLCTNGHRGNRFFPELAATNYPLLACALTTQPLPEDVLAGINPSRAAFTQFPTGLYPLVIDGRRRLVTATIPDAGAAEDGARSFGRFLRYLHRFFPHTRAADIRLESYWTGETASSSSAYHEDYPKLYAVAPGVTAAMNVGTWGNVFAPQLGTHVADWLVDGRGQDLVLELETPHAVPFQRSFALKTRRVLIPLARLADRLGLD